MELLEESLQRGLMIAGIDQGKWKCRDG